MLAFNNVCQIVCVRLYNTLNTCRQPIVTSVQFKCFSATKRMGNRSLSLRFLPRLQAAQPQDGRPVFAAMLAVVVAAVVCCLWHG